MKNNETIISPIISEKSLKQAQKGEYTFAVGKDSTKEDIKRAFKESFEVDVIRVRTITIKGRTARVWGRRERAIVTPIKKAIIILKEGQKLDTFELKAG